MSLYPGYRPWEVNRYTADELHALLTAAHRQYEEAADGA